MDDTTGDPATFGGGSDPGGARVRAPPRIFPDPIAPRPCRGLPPRGGGRAARGARLHRRRTLAYIQAAFRRTAAPSRQSQATLSTPAASEVTRTPRAEPNGGSPARPTRQ